MVKKNLVSRSEFARQAGVSAAAVTKACNSILKAAVSGKRIDAGHADAVAYLENKAREQTPPAAPGLDPVYEEAVKFCIANDRYSITGVQREFKISFSRAKSVIGAMKASGLIPEKSAEKVTLTSDDAPAMTMDRAVAEKLGLVDNKKPHVRGTEAARDTKKRESLERANQDERGVVHDIPEDIRKFADYTLRDLIAQFGTDVAFLDWLKATKTIEDIHEKRLKNAEKAGELISREVVSHGLISTIDGAFTRILTDGAKTIAVRAHTLVTTGADVAEVEDLVGKQLTTFIRPTKSKIKRVLNNA